MESIVTSTILVLAVAFGIFVLVKNTFKRKKNKKRIWWMVLLDFFLLLCLVSLLSGLRKNVQDYNTPAKIAGRKLETDAQLAAVAAQKAQSELEAKYGSAMDAYFASQEIVKKHLVAPSTAKFPMFKVAITEFDKTDNTWTVQCYVDAQNSFSAMIRSNYQMKIRIKNKDSENTNWEAINFSMH